MLFQSGKRSKQRAKKASHMVLKSKKWTEKRAKRHILVSKVDRDLNRGNYLCTVFHSRPRPPQREILFIITKILEHSRKVVIMNVTRRKKEIF
jgi:hypothetical protein